MNNSSCLDTHTHTLLTHSQISTVATHFTMLCQRQYLLLFLLFNTNLVKSFELIETKCPDLPKLDVLPGLGWDGLTNMDMSRVVDVTYNDCKESNDGKYLIPDGTEATGMKTKELHVTGELIEHWSNYTTTTAKGFKVGIGLWPPKYFSLYGSYSEDYKQIKWLQVKYRAVASRIQLRNTLYRIRAQPDAPLTPPLKEQLLEVMRSVNRNQTEKAKYLLQVIVRDYGTHYSRSVDAGAVFVKEDFLKTTFIRDHQKEKIKILSSSKVSFLKLVELSWESHNELDGSFLTEYNNAVVDKRIRAIGGPNWNKGVTADDWLAGTSENMVAIDRSGDLLSSLITPTRFPNAPVMLLKEVHEMFGEIIKEYYQYNIRSGCTHPTSPNFDYSANLEDGSCEAVIHNHEFGGVYQICSQPQYKDKFDACLRFNKKNELTGDVTCPEQFTDTLLYSQTTSYKFEFNYPEQECSGMWFWKKCWYDDNYIIHQDKITVSSYICMGSSNSSFRGTSYRFGGLYSPEVVNAHTKSNNCPTKFRTLQLFYDKRLTLCVRNNIDSSNYYSIPFGGLTSCKTGLRCPTGYNGRLATIIEGCQINYCLHSSNKEVTQTEPLLVQPPFINASELFQEPLSANQEIDYDDYGVPQRITKLEEAENRLYIGIIASFCLMFLCVLVCLVYWQRSRIFVYTTNVLRLVIKPHPKPNSRAIGDLNDSFQGSLAASSTSHLIQAWANVNEELMSRKTNYKS